MPYYPAYLDLRGRPCIVIGGGEIAARKVAALLEAGARVTVVSPTLAEELRGLADTHEIVHHARAYRRGDLDGAWLACAAAGDESQLAAIAVEAEEARVFLNVVDQPRRCGFIVPAVVRRGPVQVAVSTGGASPALAKRLARDLDATLGVEWGTAARILGALRTRLGAGDASTRGRIFAALADAPLLDALRARDAARVDALLREHAGTRTTLAELGIDLAVGEDR